MKKVVVIGSTGSIGTRALDVIKANADLKLVGIAASSNIALLEQQIRQFNPPIAAVNDLESAALLKDKVSDTKTKVVGGAQGVIETAVFAEADIVVSAAVGIAGLLPTIRAIEAGKDIALANKEVMVCAGQLVMDLAKKNKANILPVDSEHSAIFQCLEGQNIKNVKRLILTCSGGPFLGKKTPFLKEVTPKMALKHPNWSMGRKITIDSATLMNKGLEMIEARWLFGMGLDKIDVVVHPQSIIHSMVEFCDNSILAQMAAPDMAIPISHALLYPERGVGISNRLDLIGCESLSFCSYDEESFPCLGLAKKALEAGGTMPAALNGANEVAVELFLNNKIGFLDIPRTIENAMSRHTIVMNYSLQDILEADRQARQIANDMISYL